MLGVACEEAGEDPEQFASRAGENEESRWFTANAVAGAFNTAWEPKVRALGRLLAAGLIADDDAVDLRAYALPAMMDMERLHVELLDVLVSCQPARTAGGPECEPYQDHRWAGITDWFVGDRRWTAAEIVRYRPRLVSVLPGLLGTLQRHGLAVQNESASGTVDAGLREMSRRFRAGTVFAGAPGNTPQVDPTWSPTEFGERVLGFYREAADDGGG